MTQPNIFGLLEALDSAYIDVRQTRCVRVRNKNATCMKCASACTSGCISYADNKLVIAQDRCIGCGTCATVCPTCALEARHPNDARLYAQCRAASNAATGSAVVACERAACAAQGIVDPEKAVAVTCLGRIEESLIARLIASGSSEVILVKGPCEQCEHAKGEETARSVCETANMLIGAWGRGECVRMAEEFPAQVRLDGGAGNGGEGRLFSSGVLEEHSVKADVFIGSDSSAYDGVASPKRASKRASEPSGYLKVMADGTLPHFIPDRREQLLDALAQIGEPDADATVSVRLWGHVSIDASLCSSCRMCATFCPTGAIEKFEDDDGTIGVNHRAGDCVKCRCCEDICPEGAITIDDEVDVAAIVCGSAERHVMPLRTKVPSDSHSILSYMQDLISTNQIYER